MRFWHMFRRDHEALERAKRAEIEADESLREARGNAAWARRTVDVNNLTGRFFDSLRHGGKA